MSEIQQQRQETDQAALDQNLQDMQSTLLTHFKQKCGEEIQLQTKQAIAKLLYTKREIMMDIKAAGAAAGKTAIKIDSGPPNDVSLVVNELNQRQKEMQD